MARSRAKSTVADKVSYLSFRVRLKAKRGVSTEEYILWEYFAIQSQVFLQYRGVKTYPGYRRVQPLRQNAGQCLAGGWQGVPKSIQGAKRYLEMEEGYDVLCLLTMSIVGRLE